MRFQAAGVSAAPKAFAASAAGGSNSYNDKPAFSMRLRSMTSAREQP